MSWKYAFVVLSAAGFGCDRTPAPQPDAGSESGDASQAQPVSLVTLLVDTSGSMVWKQACECVTPGCAECLPDCSQGERSRWHDVLAAIGGSFEDFSCAPLERTAANGATFDVDYSRPFFPVGPGVRQNPDGLLDRHADRVRFGLATFDAMRTYTGQGDLVTLSSFDRSLSDGPQGEYSDVASASEARMRPDGTIAGKLRYPSMTTDYYIDTGIVGADAPAGSFIAASAGSDSATTNARIRQQLLNVRPFGGTPIASALDDLHFALSSASTPKQHVILITDGAPDDDFRAYPSPGCDCAKQGNCPDGEDPSLMSCPYPTASDAAHNLHCGFDASACAGAIAELSVIGFDVHDPTARAALDDIAEAGGGASAYAGTQAELIGALDAAIARATAQ